MTPLRRKKLMARLESSASLSDIRAKQRSRQERTSAWSALLFVVVVLIICISPNLFQKMPTVPVGSHWPHASVVTPYKLVVPDGAAADSQRRRLQADHAKVFRMDRNIESIITAKTAGMIQFFNQAGATSDTESLAAAVSRKFGANLKDSTLETLVANAKVSRVPSDLQTIFHHLLDTRGISADKSLLNSATRSNRALVLGSDGQRITSPSLRLVLNYPGETFDFTDTYVATFQISPALKAAYEDVVRQFLKPNITYDPDETQKRLQNETAAVNPKKTLPPNSYVIKTGEIVTPMVNDALELLSKQETRNDWLRVLGCAIIVFLTVTFTIIYAKRFNSDLLFTSRSVLMVALPVVFAVALGRIIMNYSGGMLLGAFAMPAGMVGILTVMLFDERFAIVLTTMACGLFAASTGLAFPYTLVGLVGGYTAIASLRNLQERREVLFTGIYVALTNCLMALAIGMIMNPINPDFTAGLVAALVNGLVCYILAVGALPIFENIFQITTDVRLLELTGANHKLLQMMEEAAPGTLHHSMNVAALAETAAEAVGAHYLLVRAGAYFHDVGKMVKPTYFTENQSTPDQKQIHSKLSPAMSTLIIKNHVKEGVELARAYHLPEKVIDFIPEHHGTTLIKYFYVQALKKAEQEGSDEIISEDEYRYPGPKPRSVETAILMLADSVEAIATSRFSGKNPDEVEIRRAVHEAVGEKYEDRQLNNSPLTFKDLEIIKDSFARVLLSRFHSRVKYPSLPGKGPAAGGAKKDTQTRSKTDDDSGRDGAQQNKAATDGNKKPVKPATQPVK